MKRLKRVFCWIIGHDGQASRYDMCTCGRKLAMSVGKFAFGSK